MALDLFDTHAHTQIDTFDEDREATLARAADAGVRDILNVGIDAPTSHAAIALAESNEGCWATVGLHPHDAAGWTPELSAELRALADNPRVVAVGETGLDYYRNECDPKLQEAAFRGQIDMAADAGLPVVIHNRAATDDVLAILDEYGGAVRALLHCFGDSYDVATRARGLGCLLGIGGIVTYPKSDELRATVSRLPDDAFVLETDCPWLTPQFRRGKRNEPAYVAAVAEKIAEGRGVDTSVLAAATSKTARAFFSLAARSA
jgi:TatD DNase family protein